MPRFPVLPPLLLGAALLLAPRPAGAAWAPAGVDLTRPRLLFRPADLPAIQAKIGSHPFPAVVAGMLGRAALAETVALDDDTKEAQRFKARAAKTLAFLYAVDRTLVGGRIVPFASAADRQAAGDKARDYLLNLYPRCRLLVPPPLGGWDRDISTSEELLQFAVAYDTLKGAGYPFDPADEAEIVDRLANLAAELYLSYIDPFGTQSDAFIHQNNHRSKSGAALVVAAIALAEYTPGPGDDPLREPSLWLAYGLQQVDQVMRWVLVAGDGAYGEGPFYMRFAAQNLLTWGRAWDRLVGGATWDADGVPVPSLWSHPLFRRTQRWMLDMTLPDGALMHQDDGNPGRSYYFGAAPRGIDDAAFAWRWENAPAPFEGDGNIDMGADAIVVFDPDVEPAPPAGSPSAFYPDGGNAIFRSGWDADAVVAIVSAESDEASEFGRDRDGVGVYPQSHEHAEPGSFVLYAFGERLLLDPGYFSFGSRTGVNKPRDHNVILVDDAGPLDYLGTSFFWELDPLARPPGNGHASLLDPLDSGFLDAARVVTAYGGSGGFFDAYAGATRIERRFLFADDRYLAVVDELDPESGVHTYGWRTHGNGGADSGGSFAPLPSGARWERPAARVDVVQAFDVGAPSFWTEDSVHEIPGKQRRLHTVLETRVEGEAVRGVTLVYPTPTSQAAPVAAEMAVTRGAGVRLEDAAGDRRVLLARRSAGKGLTFPPSETGGAGFASDGELALLDVHADGALRLFWSERARAVAYGNVRLSTPRRGDLGLRLEAGRVELVAGSPDASAVVQGLPFVPQAADGACWLVRSSFGFAAVGTRRDKRVVLRAAAGNSLPAADPGRDRRVAVGDWVRLDGRRSCDLDRDALTPRWELVAAPPGSDWRLEGADGWRPRLHADRPGPFRVELVVSDAHGAASLPVRVQISAGGLCEGGLDEDRDGRIDSDDPDCDAG
jgi:hypothetical protein